MERERIRWGIMGAGPIAERVIPSFLAEKKAEVAAVAARREEQVKDFSERWKIPAWYTSMKDLCADEKIDAVYVATPHLVHYEHCCMALKAGKHVLCEKPMAMNQEETESLRQLAVQKGLFLMEGMWTRFFPAIDKAVSLIREGTLGKPVNLMASFSFYREYDINYRFFRKDLGGGCMRSAGIYPVAMASLLFGWQPEEIHSVARMHNGVDLHSSALLRYEGGQSAQVYTGFDSTSICMAQIAFEQGTLYIPSFISPDRLVYTNVGGKEEEWRFPYEGSGFQYEIATVCSHILQGKTECGGMTLEESAGIAAMIDQMYDQWEKE